MERSQNILWMMQYGIFRSDYDNWLHNFEIMWLESKGINFPPYFDNPLNNETFELNKNLYLLINLNFF